MLKEMEAVLLLGLPPRPTLSIAKEGIEVLSTQAAVRRRERLVPLRVRCH